MNQKLKTYIEDNDKRHCCKKIKVTRIVFKDNQSAKLTLINDKQSKIYKVQVDGCLIDTNESQKCDWIFCLEGNDTTILIELKSEDLEGKYKDIIGQFLGTINTIGLKKFHCFCILVYRKYFSNQKAKQNREKQKFNKIIEKEGLKFKPLKQGKISISDLLK